MKEELRPCIINIAEETEVYRTNIDTDFHVRVVRGAETHKGYFHTWGTERHVMFGTVADQIASICGVVEFEDGTVHKVDPECITFTDR